MYKALFLTVAFLAAGAAKAESKTFTVGGMHCADCVADIKEKVCAISQFAKCDVKITNEKKQIGKVMLTTKGAEKIDTAKLEKTITDAGYTLKK